MSTHQGDPRLEAERAMCAAKSSFTRAARAVLAGWPLAEVMVQVALEDLEQARERLRAAEQAPQRRGAFGPWRT